MMEELLKVFFFSPPKPMEREMNYDTDSGIFNESKLKHPCLLFKKLTPLDDTEFHSSPYQHQKKGLNTTPANSLWPSLLAQH